MSQVQNQIFGLRTRVLKKSDLADTYTPIDIILSRLGTAISAGIHAMDPFLLQWRLYNHIVWNANLWSIKYNVYADQHRYVTLKTTDSNSYIMIVEAPL
jgi:hypothetical protein